MKRLLLCLIGVAVFSLRSVAGSAPQAFQPFTAVFWTTTTLHSQSGKAFIFTRRTVYMRDASGSTRTEIHRPTAGLLQDETAPLEHISTGSTSAQSPLPAAHPGSETVQVVDLGTSFFSGLATAGQRQVYKGSDGQITHTVETWFCPLLGLTVHMSSSNARGDSVNGDLSNLQLVNPAIPAVSAAAPTPAVPLLILYRNLFTLVDHIERDRRENDPNRHVNMGEIEEHLRKKLMLSASEWQTLVATSVKLESYTRAKSEEARNFTKQDQSARRANPLGPNTLASGLATLHKMQLDLNTHVQDEIDGLKGAIGPTATNHIQAYLQGPLAGSTRSVSKNVTRQQAALAGKEQAR